MADKTKDIQESGIVFGDWKLFPVDSINWELCHRHAVTRASDRDGRQHGRRDRTM